MDRNSMVFKKMSNTKLKLSDLNPHLMCVLCGGYYIDATTIVECLHSFCRSCIVKHLESSKYCPICEVQVHKTKPLINIRPDKTLQDIVYKLVPGLFANEMRNRRKFYKERPHYIKPNDSESVGEVSGERKIYVNDENITFSLVYHVGPMPNSLEDSYKEIIPPEQNEKRYFKCPTGVTIYHLKKLLRAKYDLSENNYKMEIYFKDQSLHEDFSLLDIAYIYLWKTKGSLDLTYKIFENVVKRQRIEEERDRAIIDEASIPKQDTQPMETTPIMEEEKKPEEAPSEKKSVLESTTEPEPELNAAPAPSPSPSPEPVVAPASAPEPAPESVMETKVENPEPPVKENGDLQSERKEVQLQISESGVMSVSQIEDGEVVRTVEETATKVTKNENNTGLGVSKGSEGSGEVNKNQETNPRPLPTKKPTPKPIKNPYKTTRCSPKTWNPVIPREKLRPTLIKNSDEPKKPMKFFKMRNMPRFLGNPSSGVKPMYAESLVNNSDKNAEKKKSDPAKTLNKILKIDPKTLRPIEKEEMKITPSAPNLLTNPFIPNNNHFLFSDLHLLPPNTGNFSNTGKPDTKTDKPGSFKSPAPNGTYPPICFPTPDSTAGFYPFGNLTKQPNFPFPMTDKMDPLLRATRLSPFGNLTGFNVAGFHASLPPSISRLLNPHHHFRKISQSIERKHKEESTKETIKSCDDSLKQSKSTEVKEEKKKVEEGSKVDENGEAKVENSRKEEEKESVEKKEESLKKELKKEDKEEVNGERSESGFCETNSNSLMQKDKDR